MTTALFLLMLGVAANSDAARFEFVDSFGPEKQVAPRYRSLSLGQLPARPLNGGPTAAAGTFFALARVGISPDASLGIVWQPESPTGATLWVDADGDGRLSDKEQHAFTEKTIEIPARIKVASGSVPRTIIFRRGSGNNLYLAVRGHTRGQLQVGGKSFDTALTDGDADGCFDKAGADLLWIDLNGDRGFDPFTEKFPLGTPVKMGESTFLIQTDPGGVEVKVRVRGAETGRLLPALPLHPKAVVRDVRACLVSEFGELNVINVLGKPIELPVGKYRVDALTLEVSDEKGRVWSYGFSGQRKFDMQVETNKEIESDLLRGLRLTTGIEADTAVPGNHVTVAPMWQSAAGTFVTDCKLNGASTGADIALTDAAGKILERTVSGFA